MDLETDYDYEKLTAVLRRKGLMLKLRHDVIADLTQETFLTMIRKRDMFKHHQFPDRLAVKIFYRRYQRWCRSKVMGANIQKKYQQRRIEYISSQPARQAVAEAMQSLPDKQKAYINRRFWDNESVQDINTSMGIGYTSSFKLKHKAFQALKESLAND